MINTNLFATQQINDIIIYKDKISELRIHWLYPGPLEEYFIKNSISVVKIA